MTSLFQDTQLWRTAFINARTDASSEEQAFFRLHFENARERAKTLVSQIASGLPGYTVHDVTHLDALWETADLVAPQSLSLNPPEAFVFEQLLRRLGSPDQFSKPDPKLIGKLVRTVIANDGAPLARAALWPTPYSWGSVGVGGLRLEKLSHVT
jgi:hypothetical protein